MVWYAALDGDGKFVVVFVYACLMFVVCRDVRSRLIVS